MKKKIRKARKLRKFRSLPGIALSLILVSLASYSLGWSHLLAVKSIVINAGDQQSLISSALIPRDVSIGQPLARINIAHINRDLKNFSWIAKAYISRNWFSHKVSIDITSRKPVASFVGADGSTHYLDINGIDFQLPITPSGIPAITFSQSNRASEEMAALLVEQLPPDLLSGMSSLSMSDAARAVMVTSISGHANLTILWGDASQVTLKVNVLRHLLALPENKKIVKVDLSTPLAPLVK